MAVSMGTLRRRMACLSMLRKAFSTSPVLEEGKKGPGAGKKSKSPPKYSARSGGLKDEIANWPTLPTDAPPIYDFAEMIPLPGKDYDDEAVEVMREVGAELEAYEAEHGVPEPVHIGPGTEHCLMWTSHVVLSPGFEQNHPMNRKAEAQVHVRDLQRVFELSDKAIAHIVCLVGKRYNTGTGLIRLVCERYPLREDNRKYITKIIDALVAEGKRFAAQEKKEQAERT